MYYFPGDFMGPLCVAGMVILIWRHRNTRFFQFGAVGMGLLASAGLLAWDYWLMALLSLVGACGIPVLLIGMTDGKFLRASLPKQTSPVVWVAGIVLAIMAIFPAIRFFSMGAWEVLVRSLLIGVGIAVFLPVGMYAQQYRRTYHWKHQEGLTPAPISSTIITGWQIEREKGASLLFLVIKAPLTLLGVGFLLALVGHDLYFLASWAGSNLLEWVDFASRLVWSFSSAMAIVMPAAPRLRVLGGVGFGLLAAGGALNGCFFLGEWNVTSGLATVAWVCIAAFLWFSGRAPVGASLAQAR